ncbi:MAG: hypothetical protein ACYTEK_00105 [Planctomycetota bacterium]
MGKHGRIKQPLAVIGHSRLVTKGGQSNNSNNQPIVTGRVVGIHNGIVVNDEDIWKQFPSMRRNHEVDSESILSLINMFYCERGSLAEAAGAAFGVIEGMASIAALLDNANYMLLASNNGSLYCCANEAGGVFMFASEERILKALAKKRRSVRLLGQYTISHVEPGYGYIVNILDLRAEKFAIKRVESSDCGIDRGDTSVNVIDLSFQNTRKGCLEGQSTRSSVVESPSSGIRFSYDRFPFTDLRRCKRCILPETMPFIEFDDEGLCNYCRSYRKLEPRGVDALEESIGACRRNKGQPDCLVGISGGRDSTYGLHFIKDVLKMNPIAYTYDWGMVTDLARRNISRVCGKLGVEHILVSADIAKKRKFIRMNVEGWLKKPDLGMVPLFMAGDKQYFYYANKLKRQLGVNAIFLCENMLERTDFKSGFAGVRPEYFDDEHVYTLSLANKMRLISYYSRQYFVNPSYLNPSIFDTIFACACYYLIRRDYLNLYRYVNWEEREIISVLVDEYGWETADDTKTTWRIGDGTAAFYNYLYYKLAGFTENDTFRSNQVREGVLAREEALKMVEEENEPRYGAIENYLRLIDLDYGEVMHRIERISRF